MTDTTAFRVLRHRYWPGLACVALAWILPAGRAAEPLPATVQFNRDIRPILSDACYQCHGPDRLKRKAKLRFDTEEGAFGDLGGRRPIVPGDPAHSEMFQRITATDEMQRMPPVKSGRQLTARQIELIRRWIAQGAKWQPHWSLIPPQRPPVPAFQPDAKGHPWAQWPRNPLDCFILERLQREGLTPSPEADRSTLIRRVTLDLMGLPPTPAEVDAFLADSSPDAYEKVVDRLLASPRYGERMVLEWLDAARYADSNGFQSDRTRTMWPWRDGVIRALNRNQPFDQFTIEQLAGDLLPNATLEQKIATGFNRNHMLNGEGGRIAEESRVDYVVDRVDTTATVWLGLTLGCARCHDHKFDPFTQKEYYRLFAYFNNVPESGSVDRGGSAAPVILLPTAAEKARIADLTTRNADLDRQLKAADARLRLTPSEWQREVTAGLLRLPAPLAALVSLPDQYLVASQKRQSLQKQRDAGRKALDELTKQVTQAMVMEERPQPRDTFVLQRGAYDKPGEKVSPGVPARLPPLPAEAPANRLGFARWLVAPGNPLTTRVAVNRAWQLFFGTGLVKTVEDFGVQGELPSHPELLDWLATEFMGSAECGARSASSAECGARSAEWQTAPHSALRTPRSTGWDVKALHRLIVTSATYRQASRISPALRERDPDNRLLARGPRYRLSSFTLRDQALAVSGLLVERIGGPPVKPYQPPGVWEEMTFGEIKYQQDKGPNLYRRSLYTFWRRTVGPTELFDTSARQVCTVRQPRTNTPLQSLILLNDVTYVEAARVLAERLLTQGGCTPDERITLLFRLATARPPSAAERQILAQRLERLWKHYCSDPEAARKLVSTGEAPRSANLDVVELAAYTGLASLVLNLDEVLSKE